MDRENTIGFEIRETHKSLKRAVEARDDACSLVRCLQERLFTLENMRAQQLTRIAEKRR